MAGLPPWLQKSNQAQQTGDSANPQGDSGGESDSNLPPHGNKKKKKHPHAEAIARRLSAMNGKKA